MDNLKHRIKKTLMAFVVAAAVLLIFMPTAQAQTVGNVSAAIESTWDDAAQQIKTVCNNVVFPAVSLILAVLFFVKLATSYFDYKKQGTFEFAGAAILFVGLIFIMTAPLYIWTILGI